MSPVVNLVLALMSAMPQELTTIRAAYNTAKAALSAQDQATIDAILTALNTKTDADVVQLDRDAATSVAAT